MGTLAAMAAFFTIRSAARVGVDSVRDKHPSSGTAGFNFAPLASFWIERTRFGWAARVAPFGGHPVARPDCSLCFRARFDPLLLCSPGAHENMHQCTETLMRSAEGGLVMGAPEMLGLDRRNAELDGSHGTWGADVVKSVAAKSSFAGAVPPVEIPAEQCRLWQLPAPSAAPAPPMGSKNTQGRRPRMEDTDAMITNLLEVPLLFHADDRIVPKAVEAVLQPLWEDALGSPRSPLTRFPSEQSEADMQVQGAKFAGGRQPQRLDASFHFVGVYDGHGGQMVSREAAQNLHLYFRKAFNRALSASNTADSSSTDSCKSDCTHRSESPVSGLALKRKHSNWRRRDDSGLSSSSSGSLLSPAHKTARKGGDLSADGDLWPSGSISPFAWNRANALARDHPGLRLHQVEDAILEAFRMLDNQLLEQDEARSTGSTAVVAMVSTSHLCLANCGDSRAVLSRGGVAYRLTRDHKPELDDEEERINSCGGRVLDFNGKRVMGLLAMSRALGDHCLRDVGVVAEPEVTIISRSQEDEFLVLASDGLWDALSDNEVCDLARRCFQRAKERGAAPETASRVAASVLMRAALDRGSNDNITVTVVDLRYDI
ncbi:unnamed protein product [Ostreobium quekettii]|uniref:protein-serine/threonine phosphatase n=1 Tax=Ostreobium quekettii TaxID=121088 RepID=A0A8S1JHC2_9CHLO|nr:unnamed protein product [Ostreobium quekettii]|eukprot:evm.model.scf_2400.1 EVM.evm.TU.scf_2400.1   scf_2400:12275-14484(-)